MVISNAGNTLFELAVQKVPTICIPAIEHQVPYARFFQTNGFGINLGLWNNVKNKDVKKQNLKSDAAAQKQIDVILDKISKSGYENLSKDEKDFLFKAGKK